MSLDEPKLEEVTTGNRLDPADCIESYTVFSLVADDGVSSRLPLQNPSTWLPRLSITKVRVERMIVSKPLTVYSVNSDSNA